MHIRKADERATQCSNIHRKVFLVWKPMTKGLRTTGSANHHGKPADISVRTVRPLKAY